MEYSVLMSVYKREKPEYLKKSIESMMNQTVRTKDFVLVCDGELTDELNQVVHEYEERFPDIFNIYRLPENKGLAVALNHGIRQCKNEIIARMDSDDISEPDRIEKQLECLQRINADIIGSNVREFETDENRPGKERKVPETHEEIVAYMKNRNPFNHPSVLYKKSAVEKIGYYEDIRWFEDYYLWATMIKAGYQGYNIQEPLVRMRSGWEMYKRRGGMEYNRYMIELEKALMKKGYIGPLRFVKNVCSRFIGSLLPTGIRQNLYSGLLRKD